jgi:hypothetical protein
MKVCFLQLKSSTDHNHERNILLDLISACRRDVSLMCIWRGPDWAWGHVRIEALLASRTVYGNPSDVEDLRRDARMTLQEGLASVRSVSSLVHCIRSRIASVKTFEVRILSSSVGSLILTCPKVFFKQITLRHDCLRDMRTIVAILDIHPDWHALRTMLAFNGIEVADNLRPLLSRNLPDDREINLSDKDHQFWKHVWEHLQGSSPALHTFDTGASWGSKYIQHMLAQMQISEAFDRARIPDTILYERLVR